MPSLVQLLYSTTIFVKPRLSTKQIMIWGSLWSISTPLVGQSWSNVKFGHGTSRKYNLWQKIFCKYSPSGTIYVPEWSSFKTSRVCNPPICFKNDPFLRKFIWNHVCSSFCTFCKHSSRHNNTAQFVCLLRPFVTFLIEQLWSAFRQFN